MKLLLTSGGFTNTSIIKALEDLVGKPTSEISLVFISTASAISMSDKRPLVKDFENCLAMNLKFFDILDFTAIPKENWLPRMERADVILFGGGSVFHLMYSIDKFGLRPMVADFLKTKVIAGISAGTAAMTKDFAMSNQKKREIAEALGEKTESTLALVDFYVRAHLNNPKFPHASLENVTKTAATVSSQVYAIDDNTALQIIDGEVTVISEGNWEVFNK